MSKAKGKLSEQDIAIQKLERKVKRIEKDKRRLQSENKTLRNAWARTEAYLNQISEDKTLEEIFEEIKTKTNLTKTNKECPNCGNKKMRKTDHGGFYIETCEYKDCGYKNRITNERRPKKTK